MRAWPYSPGTALRIVRRTRAGESLRAICRSEGMPGPRTVRRWMEARPRFGRAMAAARAEAGRCLTGRTSEYCEATAAAVFERLCAGEAMVSICADPQMPVASTVYRWLSEQADFRAAVGLARQIQGDRLAETGWEMALAATTKTAYVTEVRLKHLRWYAGKLWPRKYGPVRGLALEALEGEAEPGPPQPMTVVVKKFTQVPETGRYVPSHEPARVAGSGEVWAKDADGRGFDRPRADGSGLDGPGGPSRG